MSLLAYILALGFSSNSYRSSFSCLQIQNYSSK